MADEGCSSIEAEESDENDDINDRVVSDVFNRFLNLILYARLGNGTWRDGDVLNEFRIEFSDGNDSDFRVRINDENALWTAPRANRSFEPGEVIQPTDLDVESRPLSDPPADRFIRGTRMGETWALQMQLSRPHPRRVEHLQAAREFMDAADVLLAGGHLRAFYESAFHAAEHLAQAELLSYPISADVVSTSKKHQTVKSTYALWARLGNTDNRFAKLLIDLSEIRQAKTYVRDRTAFEPSSPDLQLTVLHEMFAWVTEVVQGRGPSVIHLVATRNVQGGQLVGTEDLQLRPKSVSQAVEGG